MVNRRSLLKSGAILTAGNMLSQILSLVRNMIVARLVGPEDFGVAVTFAVTLSVLEAALAHGFDKLLVQDKDGDDIELQSMLHTILVGRGLVLGAILFIAAPFLAQAFNIPEATLAYQFLALVPVMRGFAHLDVMRIQRQMHFAPSQWLQILSQLAGLVVAITYALIFHNYWAMLWGIIGQLLVFLMLTHVIASRPYLLGWNSAFTRRVIGFSWPLMLNGIVLVLSSQADRLIVGTMLSLTDLAIYGAASMLVTAFLTLLAKVAGDLSLPWISETRDVPEEYRNRHAIIGAAVSFGCVFVFAPIALLGGDIVVLFFGDDFKGPDMVMAWLAVAMGLRFLRVWPIVIAMSFGDTITLMRSNVIRGLGLIALIVALQMGTGLSGAAAAMALGEGLATLFAFIRIRRTGSEFMISFARYALYSSIGLCAAFVCSIVLNSLELRIGMSVLFALLATIILLFMEPRLLGLAVRFGKKLKSKIKEHTRTRK